ncbi:cyclic peptide export ABC transporter [Burkholderia sp. Ac-20379]|uniref:cyclic peptide export ABC transporter n=1 Tax=Burkholderia sp. Ac-20379 TaxID=2703900 RepID=UPI001981149C|nr:cyclic peptide export ABC transporter [Burkholderia sp. Ac-20379]MBN3725960.1 cyclic peptide export ABC transporter [Burkholderia sp. Ac-20379]
MYIIELLRTDVPGRIKSSIYITLLAGLANIILIALINTAANQAARAQSIDTKLPLLYLIAFAIFYIANRASLREANRFLQQRLDALRLRIANKIRHAELRALEGIGRGEIFATLAQEAGQVSQNFPLLVSAAQSVCLFAFCMLYIALLSPISFAVIASATIFGISYFWQRRKTLDAAMIAVHVQEAQMLDSLSHFTDGFQEIRLNADKNDSLFRRYTQIVERLETLVSGVGGKWVVLLLFSNAFLYALLGVVIFVLPIFFSGYTGIIYKIAVAAIFCVGPVTAVTAAAPIFARANIELEHVFKLEQRLDARAGLNVGPAPDAPSPFEGFRDIVFQGIEFAYQDAGGAVLFGSGPWDLSLRRGELVFLRGGNGSGKSTAMKLMCGLYRPDAGAILVDGVPVTAQTLQSYRELFSCIFPDFHLFDRLYGLDHIEPARVRAQIERMGLAGKVEYVDGGFSTHNLSTGQRKRLAMIVSQLEDKEIYLFDEWAADQDERFRDIFYTELLPELQRRGKTVIAVTHDDKYWHMSDRLITLDLGLMTERATDTHA